MREEINQEYTTKIMQLNENDPNCQARKEYFENKEEEDLDAVDSFKQNLEKDSKKKKISRYKF